MRVYTRVRQASQMMIRSFYNSFCIARQCAQQSVAPSLSDPRRFKLESLDVGSGAERR